MTETDLNQSDSAVPVLCSDNDFITAARDLAARLRPGAAERDRKQQLPYAELEWLRESGLLGLPVPARHGGAGASHVTIARVFAILAAADPAFAQIPQPHVSFVDVVGRAGTEAQQAFFYAEALAGKRFGNALSERGTKTAHEYKTRLTRSDDAPGTWILNGRKYYSTGALDADWVAVFALDDAGHPRAAYVPRGARGFSVDQDWTAFGQRATLSGTTVIDNVRVPDEHVFDLGLTDDAKPTTFGTYPQLQHAAIDLGIARGALEDGIAFVRKSARPWPDAGVQRAVDEPFVQYAYGRLTTLVDAAEALVLSAAALLDEAAGDQDADAVTRARLGVAKAKAFAGETANTVATELFEGTGSGGVDARHALDRHWRNARTHTLHDPNRWKYIHVGRWVLDDVAPAPANHSI